MWTAARVIFGIVGLLWLLIGVGAMFLDGYGGSLPFLFMSRRTDLALFGAPVDQVLASNPQLEVLRFILIRALGVVLYGLGSVTMGLAWLAFEPGDARVLGLFTVLAIAMPIGFRVALGPYIEAGARMTLADLPPFIWVPTLLMPLACALGWIAWFRG